MVKNKQLKYFAFYNKMSVCYVYEKKLELKKAF